MFRTRALLIDAIRDFLTDRQFLEGPVWMPDEGALVFSDIPRAELLRWTPESGVELLRACANPNGSTFAVHARSVNSTGADRTPSPSVTWWPIP